MTTPGWQGSRLPLASAPTFLAQPPCPRLSPSQVRNTNFFRALVLEHCKLTAWEAETGLKLASTVTDRCARFPYIHHLHRCHIKSARAACGAPAPARTSNPFKHIPPYHMQWRYGHELHALSTSPHPRPATSRPCRVPSQP